MVTGVLDTDLVSSATDKASRNEPPEKCAFLLRPYYQAQTALNVLELIQDPEGGSNSLSWWRRWESNPRPETLSRRRLRR